MPTYEYKCADCGADLEVVQSIHDASLTECPECGGTLRKQFGNVGVVFKGSGFYKTDSRSSEKKSKPTKVSDPAAKSDSAKSSNSDKKSSSSGSATGASSAKSTDSNGS